MVVAGGGSTGEPVAGGGATVVVGWGVVVVGVVVVEGVVVVGVEVVVVASATGAGFAGSRAVAGPLWLPPSESSLVKASPRLSMTPTPVDP